MLAGDNSHRTIGVWWDLNTCPVPHGVDPRRVPQTLRSVLSTHLNDRFAVAIFAVGNLEYTDPAILKLIYDSGIIPIHAPLGGCHFSRLLNEWYEINPPPAHIMVISADPRWASPYRVRSFGFTNHCAYPKGFRPDILDNLKDKNIFASEFVWEDLLFDERATGFGSCEETDRFCVCEVCHDDFDFSNFIDHLKSKEHREKSFDCVPKDCYGNPMPRLLHSESSEEFAKNMKEAEEDDCQSKKRDPLSSEEFDENMKEAHRLDCQSKKRNPEVDLFDERNKKQSLDQAKPEEVG